MTTSCTPQIIAVGTVPNDGTGDNLRNAAIKTNANFALVGVVNGIATLGADGKLDGSQLPNLSVSHTYVVASQAAMLALSANVGDFAVRTDNSTTYVLTMAPASTLGNWTALSFAAPVTSVAGKTGAISLVVGDVSGAAPSASPTFTGTVTVPTPTGGDNSTKAASTAFVQAAISGISSAVVSVFGRTGAITATSGDYGVAQITGAAPLASPTFTGTVSAPTPTGGDNTTKVATTAFVAAAIAGFAPIASPTFTGTAAAPTPTGGDNTTKIATTAFVQTALAGLSFAPLASPSFTGNPTAVTQSQNDNSTRLATTAYVDLAVANLKAYCTGAFQPLGGGGG